MWAHGMVWSSRTQKGSVVTLSNSCETHGVQTLRSLDQRGKRLGWRVRALKKLDFAFFEDQMPAVRSTSDPFGIWTSLRQVERGVSS
jgi:hypothetical protein